MTNLNAVLNQRIKKSDQTSKMAAMAKQSSTGNLTSFAGVFSVVELSDKERLTIEDLLKHYAKDEINIQNDLPALLSITSEVKAINNQAAILHGERIKKAHDILTRYQEGAFTAWIIATYGNRQTPYNFMQYYEFYENMPKALRPQIESMPRQAVYVLASRMGSVEKKQEIIQNYKGETKAEVIHLIRQAFPLKQKDKRQNKTGQSIIHLLNRLHRQLKEVPIEFSKSQKRKLQGLLKNLYQLVG